VAFWQQLAERNPDALIVLTIRDPDAWWRSASRTIFPAMARAYFAPDAPDDGWTRMAVGMMAAFSPQWQDEDAAKAAFVAHNDRVRHTAPAGRLLEWQPSDGWAPLCERLRVAEPDEAFPHVNTETEFSRPRRADRRELSRSHSRQRRVVTSRVDIRRPGSRG
jgi:hypothetical protein